MEFRAFDWDPNTVDFPVPWGTQQILIYTPSKASLTLHIKFDKRALIDLEIGLNFICLCNLYKDNRCIEYTENTFLSTLISKKPTKIIQYGTHTPSNRILLVAESLTFKPTLEYLSILSILRTELPELIQFKTKNFPVPVRKILENCYSHKGEVEILIFNRSAETKLCPKPKDFGKYEWVKIPICVSDLHHLGPIIKNFDFSYANFRPRKPFFFYHN
jgi:hypothetical protein